MRWSLSLKTLGDTVNHRVKSAVFAAFCSLLVALAQTPKPGNPPQGAGVGRLEPGAAKLAGYLVNGKPCLPLKKFAADAGFKTNVSPSGQAVAVIVGSKISMVSGKETALIDNKEVPLSVKPFQRDNDFYIPLEFYEKVFPHTFTYDSKSKTLKAEFRGRTLTVPISDLPAKP
jgi:Copper amine oxidase N-terminal domain